METNLCFQKIRRLRVARELGLLRVENEFRTFWQRNVGGVEGDEEVMIMRESDILGIVNE